MTLLAMSAAVLAVLGWTPADRLSPLDDRSGPAAWWGRAAWVLVALAVAGIGFVLAGVWAFVGSAVGATGARLVVVGRRRRRARAIEAEVVRSCEVVAGQLRIGQVPAVALRDAAGDCSLLERVAATAAIGGDAAAVLRQVAVGEPAAEGFTWLARAWELSERSGAPIADAAQSVSAGLRARQATAAMVASELAAPRATGRLLAGLPLIGLAMGVVSGGDPVRFLLHTMAGQLCVLGGVVLACVGVLWTEHLADSVEVAS